MPETEKTYDRILKYLNGLLTGRQRHELEKEMMQDAFDEEAFEGLNHLPAEYLEPDMDQLMNRLEHRIHKGKTKNLTLYLRIAAVILLLLGLSGILYFTLRTPSPELITQESRIATEKSPATPSAPVESPLTESKSDNAVTRSSEIGKPVMSVAQPETPDEVPDETEKAASIQQAAENEGIREIEPAPSREIAGVKGAEKQFEKAEYETETAKIITGKIVGIDGIGLAGVSVLEKGTNHGAISDLDGNFSVQLHDSGSELQLSSIGFKPIELHVSEITERPIVMQEDLLALEELVVVGYGTRKTNTETGAVSRLETRDLAAGGAVEASGLIYPVPPEGSIRAFKNWVSERTDTVGFSNYPGKHRLQLILSILSDGRIGNIRIRSMAPKLVVESYRNAVAQSPPWTPARKEDLPVESEVVIRFTVIVE